MAAMYEDLRHKHRPSLAAAVSAAAVAVLALGACGSAKESAGAGTSAAAGSDDRAKLERAALKHAECMRRQGVDVPDPKPGSGGIVLRGPAAGGDPMAERRAMHKCERYLKNVPPPRLSDEQKAAMRDGALKHARCMRGEGIDFPDPRFDERGGATVKLDEGFDPGDPRVREAERKCRRLLPRVGAERAP